MTIKRSKVILGLLLLSLTIVLAISNFKFLKSVDKTVKSQIDSGAVLFISPESGDFLVNNNFSIRIKLNTDKEVNVVRATIIFPPDKLEVIGLSKEKSILFSWFLEPLYSDIDGTIQFAGGMPSPGFKGEGEIFTIIFKPKKEGEAQIGFKEGIVLADDGEGTDVLREQSDAFYSFTSRSSSDLNDDGFINLVDFSILFSNWEVPRNPKADINKDGSVDSGDVSIMLFNFLQPDSE